MLKFHEYLAKKYGISLDEAARRSLARAWQIAETGKIMALITAFVEELPYDRNVARNSVLGSDIREAKLGYTPLYGYWTYEIFDPVTGVKTGQTEKVQEDSFLVAAGDNMPNATLRATILGWVKKYQQEAAVVKYADSDIAFLLAADGAESQLGRWSINRLSEIYSQMRFGAANGIFVFEAADDHSWSTKLAIYTWEKK